MPKTFWYADDVAAALAQWDLPAVVRIVHDKLGLTQVALANLTGYSQAHISRWLNKDGNPEGVTAQRLRRFVDGLGIPWELLGLIDPSLRESPVKAGGRKIGSGTAAEEDDPLKRRTFLVTAPTVFGVAAIASESTDIWGGKLGAAHVRYLRRATRHLTEQDYRVGGNLLFAQAASQFDVAHRQVRAGNYDTTVEAPLFGALGELARVTGWLAHDAGMDREARYHFNEALLAARLSNDRKLALTTYYSMSVQADEDGHPREALHLIRAAQRSGVGWAPGRILSVLAAAEARARAGMDQVQEVNALLARSRALFEESNNDDFVHLLRFYDNHKEVTGFEGLCNLKLRRYAKAEPLLREVADRGPNYQRNNALELARLAIAQIGQSNVTDAADTGQAVVLALMGEVVSTRTLKVVRHLNRELVPYATLPAVRSFREMYQHLISEMGTRT